ncbi:nuclear receptor ROR-beta-like [Saccostrea echinata]|uniref:nuclear receptor ROR-beta-like n=1 Tax=Saccostrea echinata TaxID=191078 RepID=UPI002A829DA6|nr:nuclear receptor ROR-beta-like [Saccostrea echinata]
MEKTLTEAIILPIQPSQSETVHSSIGQSGDISQKSTDEIQHHVQEQEVSQSSDNPEPVKQKRKKREKYIPDAVPLELPPCKICGKKASGNHYGVISCEACKGFFRRFLQRKNPYKCNKGGKCLENSTCKKNILCSACRMQKCLDCGMCREGIRQGRYTATERAHAIEEIKRYKRQNSNSSLSQDNQAKSSDQGLNHSSTSECLDLSLPKQGESANVETAGINGVLCNSSEKVTGSNESLKVGKLWPHIGTEMVTLIDNVVKGYHELNPHIMTLTDEEADKIMKEGYKKHREKVEMFGKMDPVPARVYSEIYKNTQMDIDGRMEIFQVIKEELATLIQEYVRFTHGIPGFSELPPTDQAKLLKAARLEFFFILCYRSFDSETKMVMTYKGHVYPIRQYYPYITEEMAVKWLNISNDVRSLHLTTQEHAVILAICLTFTDRCELDARDQVEKIQMLFIDAIQYLLNMRVKDDSGVHFSKIMNVFLKLREMNEEFLTFYKKMCEDPMIQKYMPELLHFLIE